MVNIIGKQPFNDQILILDKGADDGKVDGREFGRYLEQSAGKGGQQNKDNHHQRPDNHVNLAEIFGGVFLVFPLPAFVFLGTDVERQNGAVDNRGRSHRNFIEMSGKKIQAEQKNGNPAPEAGEES